MKVDMSEVNRAKASILSSRSKLQQEIENARDSMNKVVSSGELTGKVKSAINAKVDNCQVPLLDGYYDMLYNLSSEFDKVIKSFKSNVKESSDSAIIDSEVLTQLESKFSPKLTEFTEIETKFETIYSGISDLVAVESVSSRDFVEQMEKTKKVLTNTKNWMASFKGSSASLSESVSRQKAQLGRLSGTSGMSYLSPEVLTIYQDKKFKNQIDKEHKKVKEFEQPEMAAEVRKANNHGLAQTSMYYGVDKTEINQVGQGINWVAGVSKRLDDTDKKNVDHYAQKVFDFEKDVLIDTVFGTVEEFGTSASSYIYNVGTKFSGSNVSSAFYAGAKATGAASKVVPIGGPVLDFGSQVTKGENLSDASYKTYGHIVNGVIVGAVFVTLGVTGGWVIVGTAVGGYFVNGIFDSIYDNRKKIFKTNKKK